MAGEVGSDQPSGGGNSKRTFSDDSGISSGSWESARMKNGSSNTSIKKPRKARKKKWEEDYEYLNGDVLSASDSDEDWEKATADEVSSDSDPIWSPMQRQVLNG